MGFLFNNSAPALNILDDITYIHQDHYLKNDWILFTTKTSIHTSALSNLYTYHLIAGHVILNGSSNGTGKTARFGHIYSFSHMGNFFDVIIVDRSNRVLWQVSRQTNTSKLLTGKLNSSTLNRETIQEFSSAVFNDPSDIVRCGNNTNVFYLYDHPNLKIVQVLTRTVRTSLPMPSYAQDIALAFAGSDSLYLIGFLFIIHLNITSMVQTWWDSRLTKPFILKQDDIIQHTNRIGLPSVVVLENTKTLLTGHPLTNWLTIADLVTMSSTTMCTDEPNNVSMSRVDRCYLNGTESILWWNDSLVLIKTKSTIRTLIIEGRFCLFIKCCVYVTICLI